MAVLVKRHSHNSPPQAIERAMNFRGMLIADDDAMVLSRGGNAHYLAPGHYTPHKLRVEPHIPKCNAPLVAMTSPGILNDTSQNIIFQK
jgi:hypothetical protein